MATDRQQRLQEALDHLVGHDGVQGALVVTRDGFVILNLCPSLPAPETFAAMSATLVGAAEAAMGELGREPVPRVVVETPERRVAATVATDELLVIAVTDRSTDADDLWPKLEATAQTVAKLVAG